MSPATTVQPGPQPGATPIWQLVIEDMKARDHAGRAKYGRPLESHNGRDALVDLYQELLDAVVYCRQAIEERNGSARPPADLATTINNIHRDGQAKARTPTPAAQ